MDIFKGTPVLITKRFNPGKDLMENFYELTGGYVQSLLDLFDIVEGAGMSEGLRILVALDQLEIYDEEIHAKFEESGRNVRKLGEALEKELEARGANL